MPILSENRSVPIHPFPILGVVLRSHRSVFDIWIGSLSTDHVSVLREAKEDAASRLKTWINIKFYMYYNKLLWLCHSKIWWSFSLAWASGQTGLARRSNSDVGFSSGLRTSVLAAWDFLSGRFLRGSWFWHKSTEFLSDDINDESTTGIITHSKSGTINHYGLSCYDADGKLLHS